jgi:hypothetical protein
MELLPALKQHFETVMWPEIQQGITCDTQLLEAYDSVKAQVNARMNRR